MQCNSLATNHRRPITVNPSASAAIRILNVFVITILLLHCAQTADAKCGMKLCGSRLVRMLDATCECGVRTPDFHRSFKRSVVCTKRRLLDQLIVQAPVEDVQEAYADENPLPRNFNSFIHLLQRHRRSSGSGQSVNLSRLCCEKSCCSITTLRQACKPC